MKKFLDEIQIKKAINGKELAKILDCSETFVTFVKNGKRNLSYKHINNLLNTISNKEEKQEIIKKWINITNYYDLNELQLNENELKEVKELIYKKISNKL